MSLIIHINQDRYARISGQGYDLSQHIQPKVISTQQAEGDVEYHTLQGEQGTCSVCGIEADSVDAETPVDLEYIKMAMREPNKVKAGEIMDYMRAMRLRIAAKEQP